MSTTQLRPGRHARPAVRPTRTTGRRATAVVAALGLVAAGAGVALAEVTTPNPTNLVGFGPLSGEHGYPTWYEDANGLRLQQCLDIEDPYCDPVFLRGEMPDPNSPVNFPDNWPLESFYYLANAELEMPTGKAVLTSGLEATMANEAVQDGDQVVFGRQRFDIDFPEAGTYVVTHPYGVDTFTVNAEGDFRYVEDITAAPGNFGLALRSRISPFLVSTGGLITTDKGTYIGDPTGTTTVTGSPHGTNFFQIDQVQADGSLATIATTDQFTLLGKVSTNSGVSPTGAVLVENADGRFLDVFATTDAGKSVTVAGAGISTTVLDADGDRYFARIALGSTTPSTLTFTNVADDPVATRTLGVTDGVDITSATYDTETDTLTVTATSTDEVDAPALTLEGAGDPVALASGTVSVVTGAAPAEVTVTSTGGGSDTASVRVGGGSAGETAPTLAAISGPTEAVSGDQVTLTNASLNAESVVWNQTSGAGVGVGGSTGDSITFTAPTGDQTLAFTLTATGPTGATSTTAPYTITVTTERPPAPAPVAVATATPTQPLVGQTVTVSGAGSQGAASYLWTQTAGTPVTFDPTASSFTFPMPAGSVSFDLTVTNADGVTSTTSVSATAATDTLTVSEAQYRPDKVEWRFTGTASITNINTVSVYVRNANGTKGAKIGDGIVNPTGSWTFKVKGSPNPGTATQVLVESSRGGSLTVTYQRKN